MTEPVHIAKELATQLQCHVDEIAAIWAEQVHNLVDSRYRQTPLTELKASASRALDVFIDRLQSGSSAALEAYLHEVSLAHLAAGFEISEVLEAILLLRDVTLHLVWRTFSSEPAELEVTTTQLDAGLRHMASRFAGIYAEEMERHLQEKQRQSTQLLETSEGLQRVTSALLQRIVTLEGALNLVCVESQKLTGATGSAILLLEDGGWLRVTSHSGTPSPALNRLAVDKSSAGMVVTQGKPLLLNDPVGQVQAYNRNPNLRTLLVVPLKADDTIIGALDVVNKPGGFNEEDVRILSLFAGQAAIAIENAQLQERAEKLVVVEERQRIARELHDSVTQGLYSVNLYAEAAKLALSAGKSDVAAENLLELRNMTREALLDMRMLVFELHQPAWEKEGLASVLQARLEAVEARSGLQTEFHIGSEKRLPLSIEEELYRIAQEALTNAVKHARAQKLIVRLNTKGDRFYLEVQDDGKGFDLAKAGGSGGLGLHSIEQRVKRLDGELTIESVAGGGTTLTVEVKI